VVAVGGLWRGDMGIRTAWLVRGAQDRRRVFGAVADEASHLRDKKREHHRSLPVACVSTAILRSSTVRSSTVLRSSAVLRSSTVRSSTVLRFTSRKPSYSPPTLLLPPSRFSPSARNQHLPFGHEAHKLFSHSTPGPVRLKSGADDRVLAN